MKGVKEATKCREDGCNDYGNKPKSPTSSIYAFLIVVHDEKKERNENDWANIDDATSERLFAANQVCEIVGVV